MWNERYAVWREDSHLTFSVQVRGHRTLTAVKIVCDLRLRIPGILTLKQSHIWLISYDIIYPPKIHWYYIRPSTFWCAGNGKQPSLTRLTRWRFFGIARNAWLNCNISPLVFLFTHNMSSDIMAYITEISVLTSIFVVNIYFWDKLIIWTQKKKDRNVVTSGLG